MAKPARSFSSDPMDSSVQFELPTINPDAVLHDDLPHNRNSPKSMELLTAAREAILAGMDPLPISEGEGGTYRLRDRSGSVIAVYKPCDEEPMGINCPKARRHSEPAIRSDDRCNGVRRFKDGIEIQEAARREVAAYLLDHGNAAGVPWTTLATCTSRVFYSADEGIQKTVPSPKTKVGALQQFVSDTDAASNYGVSLFSTKEVHNIGLLDMRILNCDRHDGNILVKHDANSFHLVPIDHGFSLPDTVVVKWYEWTWLDWPQAKVPFDEETKERVASIDISKDIKKLRGLSIREPCIRAYKIATTFVKLAVRRGLNLYQIATCLCRLKEDVPSELEKIIERAELLSGTATNSRKSKRGSQSFYRHFEQLANEHISTLMPPVELEIQDQESFGSVAYGDINYFSSQSSSDGETDFRCQVNNFYDKCHFERQEHTRTKLCVTEMAQMETCTPAYRPATLRMSIAALETDQDMLPSVMESPYCPDGPILESNCPEVA